MERAVLDARESLLANLKVDVPIDVMRDLLLSNRLLVVYSPNKENLRAGQANKYAIANDSAEARTLTAFRNWNDATVASAYVLRGCKHLDDFETEKQHCPDDVSAVRAEIAKQIAKQLAAVRAETDEQLAESLAAARAETDRQLAEGLAAIRADSEKRIAEAIAAERAVRSAVTDALAARLDALET